MKPKPRMHEASWDAVWALIAENPGGMQIPDIARVMDMSTTEVEDTIRNAMKKIRRNHLNILPDGFEDTGTSYLETQRHGMKEW